MRARNVALAAIVLVGGCTNDSAGADPGAATLRILIEPCDGVARRAATAVVIDRGLAASVAHPFLDLGAQGPAAFAGLEAFVGSDGRPVAVRLVFIDASRDLALLEVDDDIEPLALADHDGDTSVRVIAFDTSGAPVPPTARPATVTASRRVSFDGRGAREALELAIGVQPGDSGAPVLDDDGRVIGIVFATDRDGERTWASAASEYEAALAQVTNRPVETGCDETGVVATSPVRFRRSTRS